MFNKSLLCGAALCCDALMNGEELCLLGNRRVNRGLQMQEARWWERLENWAGSRGLEKKASDLFSKLVFSSGEQSYVQ